MTKSQGWVLSGSLCGWGDGLIPRFSHAVFLLLQPNLRLQRLRLRERQRHGDRILPGRDMHKIHTEFMTWAARYDSAGWNNAVGVASAQHIFCTARLQLDGALPTAAAR